MSQNADTNTDADGPAVAQEGAAIIDLASAATLVVSPEPAPEVEAAPGGSPAPTTQAEPTPQSQPVQPLPVSDELRRAAEDVRILYSYISRENRLKPDELHEQPLSAYSEIPDRILDEKTPPSYDQRATLWRMLSELAGIAYPATADSIRNSYYGQMMNIPGSELMPDSKRPVKRVWYLGTIGFFLTLVLGLYVSFTESVMTDTAIRIEEYNRIRTGTYDLTRLEKIVAGVKPDANANAASAVQPPASQLQIEGGQSTDDAPTPKGKELLQADTGDIPVLQDIALEEIASEIAYGFSVLKITTFNLVAPRDNEFSLFARSPLQMQGYINKLISAFILPAIASLLGAVVFILRDLERRMESVALSPLRSQTYLPRIILAVIAGTVIGWLTGQDTSGVFGKISPAAASFVVGYSTEILIRLLDSFKQALGVTDPDPTLRDRPTRMT